MPDDFAILAPLIDTMPARSQDRAKDVAWVAALASAASAAWCGKRIWPPHEIGPDARALVFTGPTGRPLRRSNFNKLVGWEQACEALGVLICTCTVCGIPKTPWRPVRPARRLAT